VVPRSKAVVSRQNTRDKHPQLGLWFWEIDRVLLLLVTLLISIGIIAVAAASPAAAERYSEGAVRFDQYHYLYRQLVWVVLSVPVMLVISTMPKDRARRMALVLACIFLFCLALVPILGSEVNGAKRWIGSGFAKFQPSEFLKPCFTVGMAWLLSLKVQDRSLPVVPLSALLMGVVAMLLMKQPDFGQTVIFGTVWLALLLLSGVSIRIMGWLFGAGVAGIVGAYLFYDTATRRINDFIFQTGDTYQTDMAHATLTAADCSARGLAAAR